MKYSFSKKFCFLFSLFFLLGLLVSCQKKKIELTENEKNFKEKLTRLTSELNIYNLSDKKASCQMNDLEKYYFPEALKNLLSKTYISSSGRLLLAEKFDSANIGLIESSTFCDEIDDCSWVDDLLINLEEERIADEITDMENELDSEAMEIEHKLSEDIIVKEIIDSGNNLKFMELDDEIFMPEKTETGWNVIHALKNKVTRNIYDNELKLLEQQIWDIPSSETARMESKENYEYFQDTYKISKKAFESDNAVQTNYYNEKGQSYRIQKYTIYNEKKYIISDHKCSYDEQNRILEDEKTEYTYKKEYSKLDYKISKKYLYTYNENEEIPPDFEYYENNVIKMKNKYAERKGTYTSQIFFDGGFSVKTLYVDDVRARDVYYLNNEVTRIKNYEN